MEPQPQEAYSRRGGSDSGVGCTGLMFSDLFLYVEYLIEDLTWVLQMYNRFKCSAFIGVGEVCETPAT